MTPYILLMIMWGSSSTTVVTSIEFNSKLNCEQAALMAKQEFSSNWNGRTFYSVCVPK